MSMDGLFIHYLTHELNQNLKNSKINKIFQPSNLDVILNIRARIDNINKNVNLLISSKLDSPRIHLTSSEFQNPPVPNNFCMVLRKYIERGVIKEIVQHDNDRIIEIIITCFNELEDEKEYRLIFEIMGRNSNIILVDNEFIIIDAIRKLPPSNESERTIIPHAKYTYPTPNKTLSPFEITSITDIDNAQGLSKKICSILSKMTIDEALAFINQDIKPCIFKINSKEDFYAYPLYQDLKYESLNYFNSLSTMLDAYFKKDSFVNKVNTLELEKEIRRELKKTISLYDNLCKSNDEAYEVLTHEDTAILLQANLYKIKKGDTSIVVQNFMGNDEDVTITLNPLLSPSENLNKMFLKIKKAKKAIEKLDDLIFSTSKKIEYLEEVLFQLEIISDNEIDQVREDLLNQGIIKNKKKTFKKKSELKLKLYHVEDLEIYVGKNNIQNDYLTNKFAKSNDIWFHAKDMPGSHVILRIPNNDPDYILSEKTIRTCANIAAFFSKGKNSSSVPVDYTKVKYIKKIPGVQGFHVTYTNQKTIYIDPDENLIENEK